MASQHICEVTEGSETPTLYTAGIKNATFGKNCKIVMPANVYGCKLGNDVFVGPFVEIQKDVTIGDRTRISSHTFICSFVSIGSDCFVAHGVMFTNDTFGKNGVSFNPEDWKKTSIGNKVSVGSNVTILPVSICDNVVIGAGAVVTKDITEPGIYAGVPAKKIKSLQ